MSEQVVYHKCGAAVVQDSDGTFRASKGGSADQTILVCPTCGAVLRDRDLYEAKSDIAREKLHDVGWYPDPDGLALMDVPGQRERLMSTLSDALQRIGDADLMAIYAVIVALTGDMDA
jgi:uncharacterized C2H2 Zn-finger protein